MTPFATQFFTKREIALFTKIQSAVINMPDIDLGTDKNGNDILLSCHMLTRAVAKEFHLRYVDGYFRDCYEHIWVLTRRGHIIDVYSITTIGGPFMMDGRHGRHIVKDLYRRRTAKSMPVMFGTHSFIRSVLKVQNALRRTIPK